MSAPPDEKKSASVAVGGSRAAALQRWTARIRPALDASLLPDLIRLTAEYLSVRCRFSKSLTSQKIKIGDADADGYGRTLACGEVTEWQLSSCDEPLSALADAQGVARWSTQHLIGLTNIFGVGVPDPTRFEPGIWAAGPLQWGLFVQADMPWTAVHDNTKMDGEQPMSAAHKEWPPPSPFRFAADLTTNLLTVQYETFRWVIAVPELGSKHIYIAMAGSAARLMMDDGND